MRIKIIHETEYRFGKKVFLEPHYLRFKPKTSAHLTLESFALQLNPEPAGITEIIDIENNLVYFSWFEGILDKLTIRSESTVVVSDFDPFHFILFPTDLNNLPFSYEDYLRPLLKPVLDGLVLEEGLVAYCQTAMKDSGSGTVPFLSHLTRQINTDFEVINRYLGPPYDPETTFNLKKGSCRDLAWMQIHMLRHLGIASRFVSGYLYLPTDESEFELHAWIEVFLPGAGWFGLDPSQGMIVDNTYIPVMASAHFENTMPVTGNFRGTDATSDMTSTIQLELVK